MSTSAKPSTPPWPPGAAKHDPLRFNEHIDQRRRVRVVVYVDPVSLGELDAIAAHRDPTPSRSALVGEAISWMVAKEAAWLHRQRFLDRREQLRQDEQQAMREIRDAYNAALKTRL